MKTDLDTWMADLAAQPADRFLGDLDAEIRRDISNRRWQGQAIRAMAPARVVARPAGERGLWDPAGADQAVARVVADA